MSDASFTKWLHDGKVLRALINIIRLGAILYVNEPTPAVKQMGNITYFMNAARDTGMPESSMRGTPDLYGETNLGSVVKGIHALRKAVQVNVPECRGQKLDSPSASNVNQGTGQQWHDDSRKERWADLSDCTTDAGSHSDLDKDAVQQELPEKMRVSWPRMPRGGSRSATCRARPNALDRARCSIGDTAVDRKHFSQHRRSDTCSAKGST